MTQPSPASQKRKMAAALTRSAMLAALYAALTLLSSLLGLSYGPLQLRLAEALCLLPFFYPEASIGLFVGCLAANLLSPYGILDLVFGSLATLVAALWSRRMPRLWLAALPPVVCNMLLVGAVITLEETGLSPAFAPLFFYHALTIGAGEAVVCFGIGVPLLRFWEKRKKERKGLDKSESRHL